MGGGYHEPAPKFVFPSRIDVGSLPDKLPNYNPRLFGPGPVRRVPKGMLSFYSRYPPAQGFALCATHAMIIGVSGGMLFKYFVADPEIKAIEDYYKENPPR